MSINVTVSTAETLDNSIWSVIKEGFRGSTRDFTQGPIWVALVILAIPMILEMSMESIFAIVDIFFVGRLGAEAIAIVALTEAAMALIYAVAFGLAIGATATIARRVGEKDDEGAARTAAHVIYLGLIVSVLISAIGIAFAPYFLKWLGGFPKGSCGRHSIHADHARRQCRGAVHLFAERDISRRGRCGHCDARARFG